MKRQFVCLILLLAPLVTSGALKQESLDWIQSRSDSGELVGLVVLNMDDGRTETFEFGHRTVGDPATLSPQDVFEIGSITKAFTNLLLAELVAEGMVSYDTTIADILKELRFENADVARITLLELATHTSGLPRLPANLVVPNPADPYADYADSRLLEAIAESRPGQKLNKTYAYSNFGVGLLGYLLGRVNGSDYATALRKYVLEPLTMQGATLGDPAALVPGHSGGAEVSNWHMNALSGAGGLRASADELSRVFMPWLTGQSPFQHDLSDDLEIHSSIQDSFAVTPVWHALGDGSERIYFHNGGTGGYRSFVGFNPATGEGRVVLSNSDLDVTEFGLGLFDQPVSRASNNGGDDTKDHSDYLGHFAIAPSFVLSVFENNGRLFVQATAQPPLEIVETGVDEFTLKSVDARLLFERDSEGMVHQAVLHQNGQIMPAPRVDGPVEVKEFEEIAIEADRLADYEGRYALTPRVDIDVRGQGGTLTVRLTGQSWLPVFPFETDRFFYRAVDAQLTFNREQGDVVSLTLHQNGSNQTATRK